MCTYIIHDIEDNQVSEVSVDNDNIEDKENILKKAENMLQWSIVRTMKYRHKKNQLDIAYFVLPSGGRLVLDMEVCLVDRRLALDWHEL